MITDSNGELIPEIVDQVVVLTVKGPFNCFHTHDLQRVVAEHVEWGYSRFVIDINLSGPMDATALSQLVGSYKTVTDASGTVAFVDSRRKSTRIWEMTKLNQVIDFYSSVDDAVRAVKQAKMQT